MKRGRMRPVFRPDGVVMPGDSVVDHDLSKQLQDTIVDAEIIQVERLKAEAEIERLRGVIDRAANAWLTLDPQVVWEGDVGDAMKAGVKEIERLRGLLRECDAALGWQGHNGSCLDQSFNDYDPDCPECRLLQRVREAIGDER